MLGEDDGVGVGLDTGEEQEGLVRPGLVQPHIGTQLILPGSTAMAGVQLEVSSGERDLSTIQMVHQVRVSDQNGTW